MGIFDDFKPNKDATMPDFEPLEPGVYTFKIKEFDTEKVVVQEVESKKQIWQRFAYDGAREQIFKAFDTDMLEVGLEAEIEVKNVEHEGKVYNNLVLPFLLPEPGAYRVRIEECELETTSKGNDMLVITLLLDNKSKNKVKYRWVKPNDASSEMATRMAHVNMNRLLDSFDGIDETMSNPATWVGKCGAAAIGIEQYEKDGKTYDNAVVKKFLSLDEQRDLPAWGGVIAEDVSEFDDSAWEE